MFGDMMCIWKCGSILILPYRQTMLNYRENISTEEKKSEINNEAEVNKHEFDAVYIKISL